MRRKYKLAMLMMWSVISLSVIVTVIFVVSEAKDKKAVDASANISSNTKTSIEEASNKVKNNEEKDIEESFQNKTISEENNSSGLTTRKEVEIPLKNINNIRLELFIEEVLISVTDEEELRVIETANRQLEEREKFSYVDEGTTLKIKGGMSKPNTYNNVNRFEKKLEVFIPKKYRDSLNIVLANGSVRVNGDITLSSINIRQDTGSLKTDGTITVEDIVADIQTGSFLVNDLVAKRYKFNTNTGSIIVKSLSGTGDIVSETGLVDITYKDILEYSNIKVETGSITLNVPSKLSFEFDGENTLGIIKSTIDLNYKDNNKSKATAKIGSEPYKKITAKTSTGSINLNGR